MMKAPNYVSLRHQATFLFNIDSSAHSIAFNSIEPIKFGSYTNAKWAVADFDPDPIASEITSFRRNDVLLII